MRQKIFITFTLILFQIGMSMLYSQSINLKESNGTLTSYSLNKIKKLTFTGGSIHIHLDDSNETNFLLNNLTSIKFSDLSSGFNAATDSKTNNIIVYPNPARDILYVKLPNGADLSGKIRIQSIDGRILFSEDCNSMGKSLNISLLPIGIYLCDYISENGIQKVKFIKK